VKKMIAEVKRFGTRGSPDDVSLVAIEVGLERLGPSAIPEALDILEAGDERDEVLGGLARGLVQLREVGDPRIEAAICSRFGPSPRAGRLSTSETDVLTFHLLESLRVSEYRCPGAVAAAAALYRRSSNEFVRSGVAETLGAIGKTAADIGTVEALLREEQDDRLRWKLLFALQDVKKRTRNTEGHRKPTPDT
ncbi:MAG: HEAT repeat domain-containing protein, partial [Thermoanaerobaculia bacterium]